MAETQYLACVDTYEEEDFNHETSKRHIRHSLTHTRSTIAKAHAIHNEFHIHEEGFRVKTEERQKRAKRQTQLRLKARTRLKDSKKLSLKFKSAIFEPTFVISVTFHRF